MSKDIFVVGCGGFGREVYQVITSMRQVGQDMTVAGFVDDAPSPENLQLVGALGCIYEGTVADLRVARNRSPWR